MYAALKRSRRGPRFDRTQWAAELGFSSYSRLYRAVLLAEKKSLHQLEIALIEELLPNDALCAREQNVTGEAAHPKGEVLRGTLGSAVPESGRKDEPEATDSTSNGGSA